MGFFKGMCKGVEGKVLVFGVGIHLLSDCGLFVQMCG